MLGGWIAGSDDADVPMADSDPLVIQRISNQQINLEKVGIAITPSDGWTYLKVSGRNAKQTLNFVNESQFLIAAIKPVNFPEWPPTFQEKKRGSGSVDPFRRVDLEIDSVAYKHIVVEWFSLQHLPFGTYHDGRIQTDRQEFMVRIMSQHGYTDEQMHAVRKLCDQITGIN